jgi:cell division protein FtsQ
MKRISIILIFLSVLYLLIMPVFLTHYADSIICNQIKIDIGDSSEYQLVTRSEIRNVITGGDIRIFGTRIGELSIPDIERRIGRIRELKDAEVYTTIDGTLHVFADQRNPVMRVQAGGGDYFVDEDGVVITRKRLYTPRLQVVGGNIRITAQMLDGISVLDTVIKNSILKDIYYLVQYVRHDNFWSAQVDQIWVDNNDEIDIIPRMGDHVIHLGKTENYEGKLRNLETFYRKVLPETGWNKYKIINLEYKNQIVCQKR